MVEKGKQVAKSQEHDLKIGNPSCQILSYLLVPISILYGTTGICGRDLGVTTAEVTTARSDCLKNNSDGEHFFLSSEEEQWKWCCSPDLLSYDVTWFSDLIAW